MKFYLAAWYGRQKEMRGVRSQLEAYGHTVTSRWLDNPLERCDPEDIERDPQLYAKFAHNDLNDVLDSDILVYFNGPTTSIGRHIEFGYAYANAIKCVIVGRREIVFHVLSGVEHYPTLPEFMASSWVV